MSAEAYHSTVKTYLEIVGEVWGRIFKDEKNPYDEAYKWMENEIKTRNEFNAR